MKKLWLLALGLLLLTGPALAAETVRLGGGDYKVGPLDLPFTKHLPPEIRFGMPLAKVQNFLDDHQETDCYKKRIQKNEPEVEICTFVITYDQQPIYGLRQNTIFVFFDGRLFSIAVYGYLDRDPGESEQAFHQRAVLAMAVIERDLTARYGQPKPLFKDDEDLYWQSEFFKITRRPDPELNQDGAIYKFPLNVTPM